MSWEDGSKAEKAGDYEGAAKAYAIRSFEILVENQFSVNGRMRIGVGMMMQAVSCDVRSGNTQRAGHLFEWVTTYLAKIREEAEDPVLVGLTYEWEGDGLLYFNKTEAREKYENAQSYYENLDWKDETWSMEQCFMYFYWAFEGFAQKNGYLDDVDLLDMEFKERIAYKLNLSEH